MKPSGRMHLGPCPSRDPSMALPSELLHFAFCILHFRPRPIARRPLRRTRQALRRVAVFEGAHKAPVDANGTILIPLITWAADGVTVSANNGLEPNPNSALARALGHPVKLEVTDDFDKQVQNYVSGKSPFLRGTADMIALVSQALKNADPALEPVVIFQLSTSTGADGFVATGHHPARRPQRQDHRHPAQRPAPFAHRQHAQGRRVESEGRDDQVRARHHRRAGLQADRPRRRPRQRLPPRPAGHGCRVHLARHSRADRRRHRRHRHGRHDQRRAADLHHQDGLADHLRRVRRAPGFPRRPSADRRSVPRRAPQAAGIFPRPNWRTSRRSATPTASASRRSRRSANRWRKSSCRTRTPSAITSSGSAATCNWPAARATANSSTTPTPSASRRRPRASRISSRRSA